MDPAFFEAPVGFAFIFPLDQSSGMTSYLNAAVRYLAAQ